MPCSRERRSNCQGISRQSDIYQVGELLFSILTGGSRMDVPRDAGDDFRLNFGDDAERLHSRLQAIVSRAAHPNPRMRYRSIDELRKDLTENRQPIERERNVILGRVNDRLRRDLSKDELNALLRTLEPALAMDPGYPNARQTQEEIFARLSDLEVAADLDAARIYLESAHWQRPSPYWMNCARAHDATAV
jgi:serine/threonine protein kinase